MVEVRYRTETHTDSEGNEYDVEVPYNYYICYVMLENKNLSHLPVYLLSEEQMSRYAIYMSTLGNRPDLFPDSEYVGKYTGPADSYEVPGEYLDDETFAAMLSEAEKYIGYLREHNLMDYEAMAASTEAAVDRFHKLSEELRETEAALSKTADLMGATVDYAKTRPVFDGYKAARYSRSYLAQHEAELATYRAARARMNELLNGAKLPKMEELKKSRRELAGKKKALYAEYRKAQADMRQAVAVKANVDHLFGHTDGRDNKAPER